MGRTGRELLRDDRGDHLLAGVEAERALDGNENVVRRRQVDVPAPDQAAAACGDHFLHLVDGDVDPGQHLHGVGGPGRRGDRARGCLGDGEAMCRDDRDDDHGGAVSRNAADAMLVDDDGAWPFQLRPGDGHRMNQSEQLAAGHEARRTDQERRDLHVRIAVMREVLDDGVDLGRLERSALNLAANGIEAFRRCGRADRHETADRLGEAAERRLGEPDFIGPDQGVVVGDQERGKQHLRATLQFDPAEAAKNIRPQRARVTRNHHHVFASGVQVDPADLQWRTGIIPVGVFGHLNFPAPNP